MSECQRNDNNANEYFRFSIQHIFYFVKSRFPKGVHQRAEVICVTKQNAPGCNAHRQEGINVSIKVPPTSPSDLSTSRIIKVKYFIRVRDAICLKSDRFSFQMSYYFHQKSISTDNGIGG